MSKYNTKFADGDKKQVTFYISKKVYDQFCRKYPNMATTFYNKAVRYAIKDVDFFKDVIFSDCEY